jgi:enoyl-CoA hydratase
MPGLYETILKTTKPTIAAVNGDAVGGGFELALSCDIRIASTNARFGLPEVLSGMVPRFGALAVARMSSVGIAMELALSGALISAEVAAQHGLVNRLVDPRGVLDASIDMAETLVRASPTAVSMIKRLLLTSATPPLVDLPMTGREFAMYDSVERVERLTSRAADGPADRRDRGPGQE